MKNDFGPGLWFVATLLASLFVVSIGYYVSMWLAVALWFVITIILMVLRPQ